MPAAKGIRLFRLEPLLTPQQFCPDGSRNATRGASRERFNLRDSCRASPLVGS